MSKPIATMPLRDTVARTTSDAPKGIGVPWRDATDVLLLERPARFNRIEVRRVRRQVDHANTARSTGGLYPRIMVGPQIVHDHDVAAFELGQQFVFNPRNEAVLVGGCKLTCQHDPSGEPNRSEQREVRAPVHRNPIDELLAAPYPRMAPAHRHVHPGLVEEHEPVDRYATDLFQVRRTLDDDVRPQTLQWPSALFFTT